MEKPMASVLVAADVRFTFKHIDALLVLIRIQRCVSVCQSTFVHLMCFNVVPNLFFQDNWAKKALRRRSTGTGSMSHLREVQRRWKNHFREGVHFFLFRTFLLQSFSILKELLPNQRSAPKDKRNKKRLLILPRRRDVLKLERSSLRSGSKGRPRKTPKPRSRQRPQLLQQFRKRNSNLSLHSILSHLSVYVLTAKKTPNRYL